MSTTKESLRQEALRHRTLMDPASEDPDAACDIFFEVIKPQSGQVIAAYWPKGKEFSPYAILERLLQEGFTCALPVTEKGSRVLKFARWRDGDSLAEGAYGVLEPAAKEFVEPDIIIVPLLAFDRRGYRLGYGGGYYDATLQDLRRKKKIIAVGIAYAQQATLFNLPSEEHDEKLDFVITPQQAHQFI